MMWVIRPVTIFIIITSLIIYKSSGQTTNTTSSPATEEGYNGTSSSPENKISKGKLIGSIVGIICLLILSGLISGISLALLCLDITDLRVISTAGSEKEQQYAKRILPIRRHSNYIICAFIIAEVAVDSATTVLIEGITNSWIAILVATILITIFGGIVPQVVCHRYSLLVGAKTYILAYIIMIITFPLAYPISKLMDVIIGDDVGQVHSRKYLMSYIEMTKKENSLGKYQVSTITGTLQLKDKTAAQAMTPLKDVFMLSTSAIINQVTLNKVLLSGYSRIPIYEKNRENIVGLIHIKELVAVFAYDLSITIPVKFVVERVPRPLIFIDSEAPLNKDSLVNRFKEGLLHLAFVVKSSEKPSPPDHPIIGILTLEDLIEEILQTEINDESDLISDNKFKKKRKDITYAHKLLNSLKHLKEGNTSSYSLIQQHNNNKHNNHNLTFRRSPSHESSSKRSKD